MWRRQRRLWWTSGGGTPLTTPHWPSTARLWRESAALNSWGCTSRRISPGPPTPCHSPRRHNSAYTFLRRLKRASLPPPILTTFYRGTIESVLTSCITVWYGNCSAADRKTLQRTVNTAAKIIGAPLPSILDIFLARCSSKTNSIVKDPTHPSHSLFQLLPLGRRYRSIRARSARLLNSFFPQAVRALNSDHHTPLWNSMKSPTSWNTDPPPPPLQPPPPPQPYLTKEKTVNFFCAIQVCYTQVSGPVHTTCSNTLLYALDTFLTLLCVHNPTKDSAIYVFTCSCTTTNHLVLFPSQLLDSQCFSLHMYSIYVKHSHSLYSLYFLSLSLVV